MTHAPLTVAGLGLSPDECTPAARRAVEQAEVLVGGRRLLERFPDHPAERLVLCAPLEAVIEAALAAWKQGRRVVVLADGDPLFFGIGETLLKRLPRQALRFVPGVGALQAAAARLGRSWRDLPAVSLHGRDDLHPLFLALQERGLAAVFADAAHGPASLARTLRERGGEAFVLHVFENMGSPDERSATLSLAQAEAAITVEPHLTVVERLAPPEIPPAFGLPDAALARDDAVYTKAPVRAVSLSLLGLAPNQTLWDCGAGTGAVALEAAVIARGARIFALEGKPERFERLRQNIQRTGLLTVTPVPGRMPDNFADLPAPDRVFLGGGLGRGVEVLAGAWERLAPGGVLVANCALLNSLERARSFLTPRARELSVTLVQSAASAPLAGGLRLAPENPVFVARAVKELASGGQRGAAPLDSPPGG